MFDPAIKLFGKTIPLQDACSETTKSGAVDSHRKELGKPDESSSVDNCTDDNGETPIQSNKATIDRKIGKDTLKIEADVQEKFLKRPDKIIPCPRCNSLETKFCYYNNYNVNQPRHFCKKCQRYWTAGGTMRNVPVGAGRRKNKHIASQYRHMMSSDGIPTSQVDTPELATPKIKVCDGLSSLRGACNGNGSLLEFATDVPLCESMVASLNLGDQKQKTQMNVVVCGENVENPVSCVSSACSKAELMENVAQMEQQGMGGYIDGRVHPTPQNSLPCYPCPPWIYPWHAGLNNINAMAVDRCPSETFYGMNGGDMNQVQWGSTSMVVAPNFCTPTTSFPFVPASYWGCMSSTWASGAWNMPWNGSCGIQSSSSSSNRSGVSSNGSPTLGKHSRDATVQGEETVEKCLWAPKTLRIDDPTEAAKSSIWDTLGISPTKSEPILKGGIFKAFQPKTQVNCSASDTSEVLQANPAALSRSQAFQERV